MTSTGNKYAFLHGPDSSTQLVWSHEGRIDVLVRYVEKRLAMMFQKPQSPPKPDPLGRKTSKSNKDVFGNPILETVHIRVSAELKLKQVLGPKRRLCSVSAMRLVPLLYNETCFCFVASCRRQGPAKGPYP